MANTIHSDMYISNQPQGRVPSPDLGKDEFLKILMTQLQNQDPLDPMDDKDFIAQMATFSSLEQQMKMASSIDQLVKNQHVSPVIQYSHMIGKEVSYLNDDNKTHSGTVVSVSQQDGAAIFELSDGRQVYANHIQTVSKEGVLEDADNGENSEDDIIGEPDGEVDE